MFGARKRNYVRFKLNVDRVAQCHTSIEQAVQLNPLRNGRPKYGAQFGTLGVARGTCYLRKL